MLPNAFVGLEAMLSLVSVRASEGFSGATGGVESSNSVKACVCRPSMSSGVAFRAGGGGTDDGSAFAGAAEVAPLMDCSMSRLSESRSAETSIDGSVMRSPASSTPVFSLESGTASMVFSSSEVSASSSG